MRYENFKPDYNKPTIITAQQYGTKVSVELDHSDTDIDELFDAFETLVIGLGYHADAWKSWIVERAAEYDEEENEKWEDVSKLEDDFFGTWDDYSATLEQDEERYAATKEDEDEFDDYGQRINNGKTETAEDKKPTWDWNDTEDTNVWGNEPEDDDLFDEDEIKPNKVLIDAKKQYDEQMKMNASPKKRKKKSVEDWENEIDLGGQE